MSIRGALTCMPLRPYTDKQWSTLPQVILTSDAYWYPTCLDREGQLENEECFDTQSSFPDGLDSKLFNEYGECRNVSEYHELHFFDSETFKEGTLDDDIGSFLSCNNFNTKRKEPEHNLLKPLFNWLPINLIKNNFELCTQHARTPDSSSLKKTYRSSVPVFNFKLRSEPVATDTVHSDSPAMDDGSTCAQIFVGTETLVTDVHVMKTDKKFVNALEEHVRKRGAMDKLISDSDHSYVSNRVKGTLRVLFINDWQSDSHYQHQNFSERRCQTVKRKTNTLLDRTGSPSHTWLLSMTYFCFVLNHTYNSTIQSIPINAATGSTCYISPLLRFHFCQHFTSTHITIALQVIQQKKQVDSWSSVRM